MQRLDEAITSYDKAIQLNPDNEQTWMFRGLALADLRQYDKAIDSYDKAIKIKHDYYYAWANRGWALQALKRYDEAQKYYKIAIKIYPSHALARDRINELNNRHWWGR